ncbi:MAG TPA: hypothetical protein VNK04_13255 [Gemmataceae bacterium]|jgi:methyl-accepting chemotaxis protein|nr:hypothetical protein [Gemmataceae bacterium]
MREERSRIWVDPFQSKLFLRVVGYWLIYQFSLWNCLFAWRLLAEGQGNLLEQYGRFCLEFYPMLLCFLVLVPFFAWDAVRFSHRLVGPISRFRQAMQDIAAGQPVRPIQLRQGDYLSDLQDDFNAMLAALRQRGLVTTADDAAGDDARTAVLFPQVSEKA